MNGGPALVSIMRQGQTLVASVHTALDDSELARFEHDLIELAIQLYSGHMSEVARRLGIGRSTLYRKVREQGIEMDEAV